MMFPALSALTFDTVAAPQLELACHEVGKIMQVFTNKIIFP